MQKKLTTTAIPTTPAKNTIIDPLNTVPGTIRPPGLAYENL